MRRPTACLPIGMGSSSEKFEQVWEGKKGGFQIEQVLTGRECGEGHSQVGTVVRAVIWGFLVGQTDMTKIITFLLYVGDNWTC